MQLAYVVLSHTAGPDPDHIDFLIEMEPGKGDLLTFRLPAWPVTSPTEVRRLRDHRRLYLTYQGPISGHRGQVAKVAAGTASLTGVTTGTINIGLDDGRRLRFELESEDRWWVREA
jgi:hypothetical protein